MKIVEFERPGSKEAKEQILKDIQESKSFIVTYYNGYGDVTFHEYNMNDADIIAAIEMVKLTVMMRHLT